MDLRKHLPPHPSQTAPTTAQPLTAKVEMPTDPAALLALATKKNGLQNVSGPWHLKATYEVLDEKGGVKETGTLEEFWISAKKNKLIYSSPGFNQTDYSSETGVFRVGDSSWPNEAVAVVQKSFFPLFPSAETLAKLKFKLKDRADGGVTLKCAQAEALAPAFVSPNSLFCFSRDAPVLRIALASSGLYEVIYNRVSLFRGVYIPQDTTIGRLGKPFVHIRIDNLDSNLPDDLIPAAAPPGAIRVNRRSPLECDATGGGNIQKLPPHYPVEAKSARVQGVVYLAAVVNADGKVAEVRPLTGPSMLIDPSLESVRQWTYKPCQVEGAPVEVETVVRVVFSLGG